MRQNFHSLQIIENSRMKIFAASILIVFALSYVAGARTNRQHQITSDLRHKNYTTIDRNLNASSLIPGRRKTSNEGNNKSAENLARLSGNQNRNLNNWQTTNSVGNSRLGAAASNPEWPVSSSRYNSGRGYSFTASSGKGHILKDVEEFEGWEGKSLNPEPTTTSSPTTTFITTRGKNYHKNHDGRHICMQHKTVHVPVKTTEVFTRPTWKHVTEPCQSNKVCTRVHLVHEPAMRDVIRHKTTRQIIYDCCPGWEQSSKNSNSCMKPTCKNKCQNGGTCMQPETCSCPSGFTGQYCEQDINECKENKPCDQLCFNTEGSYYCKCREGFMLQFDKQSCKKVGGSDDAFEARDLENEVDTTEEFGSRLHKVEKMLANERSTTHELNKALHETSYMVNSLKTRLSTLEQRQQDISSLQNKLIVQDEKTKKLEHLISVLFKCKTNPHAYCP